VGRNTIADCARRTNHVESFPFVEKHTELKLFGMLASLHEQMSLPDYILRGFEERLGLSRSQRTQESSLVRTPQDHQAEPEHHHR
jgi:hypothetical protein